jgi:hypothetical protein
MNWEVVERIGHNSLLGTIINIFHGWYKENHKEPQCGPRYAHEAGKLPTPWYLMRIILLQLSMIYWPAAR